MANGLECYKELCETGPTYTHEGAKWSDKFTASGGALGAYYMGGICDDSRRYRTVSMGTGAKSARTNFVRGVGGSTHRVCSRGRFRLFRRFSTVLERFRELCNPTSVWFLPMVSNTTLSSRHGASWFYWCSCRCVCQKGSRWAVVTPRHLWWTILSLHCLSEAPGGKVSSILLGKPVFLLISHSWCHTSKSGFRLSRNLGLGKSKMKKHIFGCFSGI